MSFGLVLIVKCIPNRGGLMSPDKHSFVDSFALLLLMLTLAICPVSTCHGLDRSVSS